MDTIIDTDNIESREDWVDKRDILETSEVCQVNLKNGLQPKLRTTEGHSEHFVDFRKNRFILDWRDGELTLYEEKKPSSLESLGDVQKVMNV